MCDCSLWGVDCWIGFSCRSLSILPSHKPLFTSDSGYRFSRQYQPTKHPSRPLITCQVLSIVSVCMSWVWWVTFVLSIIGMVMIQILSCCRQSRSAVFASATVAMFCGLASVGIGIYIVDKWKHAYTCYPFFVTEDHLVTEDDFWYDFWSEYNTNNYCEREIFAAIAFICGFLWFIVCGCLLHFVTSGRHAKWEALHSEKRITTGNNNSDGGAAASDVAEV